MLARTPCADVPALRGLVDGVVWTLELFARLEQRDRARIVARDSMRGAEPAWRVGA